MHGVGVWHGVTQIIFTMPVNLQISNVIQLTRLTLLNT